MTTWKDLEGIRPSERNQKEKDKYRIIVIVEPKKNFLKKLIDRT